MVRVSMMRASNMEVEEAGYRVWFVSKGHLPPSWANCWSPLRLYHGARLPIATAWDGLEFL